MSNKSEATAVGFRDELDAAYTAIKDHNFSVIECGFKVLGDSPNTGAGRKSDVDTLMKDNASGKLILIQSKHSADYHNLNDIDNLVWIASSDKRLFPTPSTDIKTRLKSVRFFIPPGISNSENVARYFYRRYPKIFDSAEDAIVFS